MVTGSNPVGIANKFNSLVVRERNSDPVEPNFQLLNSFALTDALALTLRVMNVTASVHAPDWHMPPLTGTAIVLFRDTAFSEPSRVRRVSAPVFAKPHTKDG